jgi:hypothetical protein
MKKPKWDRSLGTSKREQGIVTPKDQNRAKNALGKLHVYKWLMAKAGLIKPQKHEKMPLQ